MQLCMDAPTRHCLSDAHAKPLEGPVTWRGALLKSAQAMQLHVEKDTPPLMSRPGELLIIKALLKRADMADQAVCIKMRYPLLAHQHELDTHMQMVKTGVHRAFVPMLCAFEFEAGKGRWGGLCMPYVDETIGSFMAMSPKPSAPFVMQRLALLYHGRAKTMTDTTNIHGIPLSKYILKKGQFEMDLLAVCFRLLRFLHKNGWVHGDTHMGNFMLDTRTWRVYLIDAERSFQSQDPVQYLLDGQELFGHASALLLSIQNRSTWDMQDVWGVMSKMHACGASKDQYKTALSVPLCNFMPVCTCFVHDDCASSARLAGCKMCTSKRNRKQAMRYVTHGQNWFVETTQSMLDALRYEITTCRTDRRSELKDLAATLTQHAKTIRALVKRATQTSTSKALLRVMATHDVTQFRLWLSRVLYSGTMVKGGAIPAHSLVARLREGGLTAPATLIATLVAEYRPLCCHAEEK